MAIQEHDGSVEQPENNQDLVDFYVSGNDDKQNTLDSLSIAHKESMARGSSYTSTDTSVSVRPPFHRLNYEAWRKGEAIPKKDSDIMIRCRESYDKVGVIKSVVDLMTEIAVEGLKLISEDENTQNFYDNWSKRVNLKERAERFANYYLVEGNVVVRRKVGEIDTPEIRRMRKTTATMKNPVLANEPGILPLEYVFYDPATIELLGQELAIFAGVKTYGIKITNKQMLNMRKLLEAKNATIRNSLPDEIRKMLEGNSNTITTGTGSVIIPIANNRLYVAHNKKKDSEVWAKSFIYSILHDVIYNEKLRLAKLSALDGWHDRVRVWKLGDHNADILPAGASFSKLASILQHHPGGTLDILWDSMIDMEEFYPPIEKLGDFDENFDAMMLGLGVPRTLVGGSESAGLTNMFIGLRNMMKRIDGVRRAIEMWIQTEIDIISNNLGFRKKPKIHFSLSNLFDQQSYFKLIIDLYDRQVISDKSVLDKIGEHVDIERFRSKEEFDLRENGDLAPRRNPFDQPVIPKENREYQTKTTKQQQNFQKEMTELQQSESDSESLKEKPKKQTGRPPGSKDTKTRNRRFKTKAEFLILGDQIQSKLDKMLDEPYLVYNNVDNKRKLTSEQRKTLDVAKLELLASLDNLDFDETNIESKINASKIKRFFNIYNETIEALDNPTNAQLRMIRSEIFTEINLDDSSIN